MSKTILLYFLVCLIGACARVKDYNSGSKPMEQKEINDALIGDIEDNTEPIRIQAAALTGNILEISVSYVGGCRKHELSLVGSQAISKSLPPRRAVKLLHRSIGDTCKRNVTEKIYFNIENLAYRKESGSKIILDLNGYKEAIEYIFN